MRDEGQKHPEPGLTPAEQELEAALAALRPAVPAIDRDLLLFRAGQAAARRRAAWQIGIWRSAAAVLLVGLGVSLAARNAGPGSAASSDHLTGPVVTLQHGNEMHPARVLLASNPPATPRAWLSYWFAPTPATPSQTLCVAQNQPALDLSIPLSSLPDDDSRVINFSLGLER